MTHRRYEDRIKEYSWSLELWSLGIPSVLKML